MGQTVGVENGNTEMPGWGKNGQKSVWRKTGFYGKVREVWSTGIKDVCAERQIIIENTNTGGERCLEDLQSAQKPIGRLIPEKIPAGSREREQWSYWKCKTLGILAEKGRI